AIKRANNFFMVGSPSIFILIWVTVDYGHYYSTAKWNCNPFLQDFLFFIHFGKKIAFLLDEN
ncbi:MAG: hypothetical protein ACLUNX_06875, partial [Angelakisella sp.]